MTSNSLQRLAVNSPESTATPSPTTSPTPSPVLLAPATLTYSSNPASYKVATAIVANIPSTTGGTPTSYSITPALSAGLAFNSTTGAISGTPSAVAAATNYTVRATNAAGSTQATLNITVATNVVAPSNLSYLNLAPVFVKGTAITALLPTSQGGAPTSYAISPALPAGLAFSTTTGAISGTPTASQVMTPHQVTATNAAGSTSVTLAITVRDPAPVPSPTPTPSYSPTTYTQFRQVLQNRCFGCHESAATGNFSTLDETGWLLSPYLVPGNPAESRIYNFLIGADSPTGIKNMPKGGSAIPLAEREIIKNYIIGLQGKAPACAPVAPHFARAGILSKKEFNNAILDLLGVAGNHSSFFPTKVVDSYGFDNKGASFPYDPVFAESLYDKIEALVNQSAANQAANPVIYKCGTVDYTTATCLDTLINSFGLRAYRRPLTAAEKTAIVTVANTQTNALDKLKTAYIRILMSPEFMFKLEPDNGATAIRDLNHYEIASRLSFLLWSSVPDATLLDLASQSRLRDPATLTAQVTRMLADPKGVRFVDEFTGAWLGLDTFASLQPSTTEFPNFTPSLKLSMQAETQTFLRDVLRNKPLSEMLTAKYSYINNELANFYGIQPPNSTVVTQVPLPATSQRRGLLSQGMALTMMSRGQEHRPVVRGSFILGKLLCDMPAGTAPPNAVNELQTLPPNPTFKDILIAHRSNPNCAGCHVAMDPIGLAFDHFNGIGKFRSDYGALYKYLPVDTSESLYGKAFQSSYDITDILVGSDNYYRCVVENSYAYAIRAPELNDEKCEVRALASEMRQQNLSLPDFIRKIVVKPQFLKRKPE